MKKVLVAEDDEGFRVLVTEILKDEGYSIISTTNGLEAWNRLKQEGADLAILDINMPEMDGLQLLKKIRTDEQYKNIPVLLLTVKAFTEDQVSGYETGADDYLVKPFETDILLARLKVLERRILKK
ncbi:MAG: response regulator [Elusimicrobia bacterium]|nr:response regulator [Elusimicrobiota bacterium]